MRAIFFSVLALSLSGCISDDVDTEPLNKPEYQLLDAEELERRRRSCEDDPYQRMCQPPGS